MKMIISSPARRGGQADADQGGFALIAVLWAAMILAAIIASISSTGRTESQLARTRYAIARLDAAADAAVNIAILRMLDPSSAARPLVDGTPFTVEFAGLRAVVTAEDESGKIDLNLAQGELLRHLFVAAGVDPQDARVLTAKVVDWRGAGDNGRPVGAWREDYRDAGVGYGPRRSPFESVEEIQLVLGMTPELFQRLAPSLTVYSQTPWVDPTFAPRDVLTAISAMGGPSAPSVMAARSAGNNTGVMIGHAFTMRAEIEDADQLHVVRTAIIRLTGVARGPIAIYRWQ